MPLIRSQVRMDDGATRSTLATATTGSVPQPLPADAVRACPDFAVAANRLRAAVAATGDAYASILDKLMYGSNACAHAKDMTVSKPAGSKSLTNDRAVIRSVADGGAIADGAAGTNEEAQQPRCYSAAVRAAESLEHFHVFTPAPDKARAGAGPGNGGAGAATEHTLGLHSDIGMFLVSARLCMSGERARVRGVQEEMGKGCVRGIGESGRWPGAGTSKQGDSCGISTGAVL